VAVENIQDYDVVHIHSGRDLISVRSMALARACRRSYVTQTHGMIQPDHRIRARVMDAASVRRLLRAARARFVLTEHEQDGLLDVLGTLVPFELLPNGVPEQDDLQQVPKGGREVLFCARLHERKRPVASVGWPMSQCAEELPRHSRSSAPTRGELAAVQESINGRNLQEIVRYEGALPYQTVRARMMHADVYVLPSVDEPFPMSLLEALALGVPSVCTDTCHIAAPLRDRGAAIVTDGSTDPAFPQRLRLWPSTTVDLPRYRVRAALAEQHSLQIDSNLQRPISAISLPTSENTSTGRDSHPKFQERF